MLQILLKCLPTSLQDFWGTGFSNAMLSSLSHVQSSATLLQIATWTSKLGNIGSSVPSSIFHSKDTFLSLSLNRPEWSTARMLERLLYMMDMLLERHPMS